MTSYGTEYQFGSGVPAMSPVGLLSNPSLLALIGSWGGVRRRPSFARTIQQ